MQTYMTSNITAVTYRLSFEQAFITAPNVSIEEESQTTRTRER